VHLYNAAFAFVLPYSYEAGASLTTLEAQATGLPVITMDTPGLREATGNAALYLEAASAPAIQRALDQLAASEHLRAELAEAGLAFARRFTWKRTAEETLAILHAAGRGA
jgi:glycosyltransferase involved in cell wall biosynthesis